LSSLRHNSVSEIDSHTPSIRVAIFGEEIHAFLSATSASLRKINGEGAEGL
jgi:hypothetical protein